ncbi:hypothetical protein D9K94_26845 [Klebsiella pneumoniae]|nr:hypothetical protein DMQ65_16435 [Klebsiella pneumoniae]RLK75417.1 hypothetical protein D9K94_26845 [Klebsiella pneumoniae]RLK94698.1 hypothetical protein D9K83_15550 [Klebsiella pneumoniae]
MVYTLNNSSCRTKRLAVLNSACAGPVGARPRDGPSYCQRTCSLKYDGYKRYVKRVPSGCL